MIKRAFVIYNPNSTGDALANAEHFKEELGKARHTIDCTLLPTAHAGHAEELAREHADGPSTMIISSSGDGGFHEVVNGILGSDSSSTIAGLLPSGNANDHYHSRHRSNLVERIGTDDIEQVDVIKISWADQTRYAHSYIGLGVSADIGHSLTKTDLNPINELLIAARHLLRRRTVRLQIEGKSRRYDSIIYAVVDQMSKYLDTGADRHRQPGELIVVATRAKGLWHMVNQLMRRVGTSNEPTQSIKQQSFTTRHVTKIQCDGEIYKLPREADVTISCEKALLHEIV